MTTANAYARLRGRAVHRRRVSALVSVQAFGSGVVLVVLATERRLGGMRWCAICVYVGPFFMACALSSGSEAENVAAVSPRAAVAMRR